MKNLILASVIITSSLMGNCFNTDNYNNKIKNIQTIKNNIVMTNKTNKRVIKVSKSFLNTDKYNNNIKNIKSL